MDNIANVETIQIAVKSVGGSTTYKIYDCDLQKLSDATTYVLETATDMYYDITRLNGKDVVIANTGENNLQVWIHPDSGISCQSETDFLQTLHHEHL